MRWPRTRYMLMSVSPWFCLTRPAVLLVGGRVVVALPLDRLVGDLEGGEDRVVEAVAAHQAVGDVGKEQTRLGALDDPVVIVRGDGHRPSHAEVGEHPGVGRLEPGG